MKSPKKIIPPILAAALMTTASGAQEVPRDRERRTSDTAYAAQLLQTDQRSQAPQRTRAELETRTANISTLAGMAFELAREQDERNNAASSNTDTPALQAEIRNQPPQAQPARIQSRDANIYSLATLQNLTQRQPRNPQPNAPVAVAIDWSAVQIDLRRQRAQASEVNFTTAANFAIQVVRPTNNQAAEAANTRLPVLLPSEAALQINGSPTVLLFPHENFYTASITGDRVVIEVFGTRLAHARAPDARAARNFAAGSSGGYRIAPTEYGQEVHFNRYGAAYSVTIECDRPDQDVRCTSGAYARQLAESLVIAAGSPGEGG